MHKAGLRAKSRRDLKLSFGSEGVNNAVVANEKVAEMTVPRLLISFVIYSWVSIKE